jgi:RNA polymerase sigma factor (TIGR02999 family)
MFAHTPALTMKDLDEHSISRILADFTSDERIAVRALLPQVYHELRRLAAAQFAQERADHTLQPTALVNEIYLRLGESSKLHVDSRAHFFRLASKVMRQVLVDHARARSAAKRGGDVTQVSLTTSMGTPGGGTIDLILLEDALGRLAALNADAARLVELRFFGGLTEEAAAAALNMSRTQASREWRAARAWLADELDDSSAE